MRESATVLDVLMIDVARDCYCRTEKAVIVALVGREIQIFDSLRRNSTILISPVVAGSYIKHNQEMTDDTTTTKQKADHQNAISSGTP